MKNRFFTLSLFLLIIQSLFAQKPTTQSAFQLNIRKANQIIKLDGELSEADWQEAAVAKDFQVHYPQNGQAPKFQTEARATYDKNFLYVGFVCYDTGKYVIQTLKRDVDHFESDGVSVVLDPNARQINGFFFGTNTEGVQTEGLLGGMDMSLEWDNKWYVETKKYADRWTAEMAIPFKTLRYDPSNTVWHINFVRNAAKEGNWHTWTKIPQQFDGISLAFTGSLNWDAQPPSAKSNISIIPYLSGSVSKDYLENGSKTEGVPGAGLDAKIALNASLNVDVTLNPDFSQVEVDEQVTNLTRFNIFFPERRTFFLENSDILENFGTPQSRPFFSRRIGLDEQARRVPILYGVRLSGNLTNSTRINALNMHTKIKNSNAGDNYSALALQKTFWGRSNFNIGFLNRQRFNKFESDKNDYGRNLMASLVLVSKDNKLDYWIEGHHSFKPEIKNKNNVFMTGFLYRNSRMEILQNFSMVGTNYYADMGFFNRIENYDASTGKVVRLGYNDNFTQIEYFVRPKEGVITEHRGGLENLLVFNPDWSLNEWFDRLRYFITFRNTSELKLRIDNNIVNLPFPFEFSSENAILTARNYRFLYSIIQYDSDIRKPFSYNFRFTSGEYYNGSRIGLQAGVKYRVQPWGNFGLRFDWNRINLPAKPGYDGITQLFLISPKIEINFNKNTFWTTFLQYNTQGNNFNVNSRLQWRFKPMSDLFLVYTDNYFVQDEQIDNRLYRPFDKKNRALVCKLTYWLNL